MAGTGLKGLKGLKGIAALSDADYNKFVANNRDVIARHGYDPSYIAGLYQNKQFLDKYGEEAFDALPNARLRNEMFRQDTINEEFNKRYNLKFNKNGMSDNDFQKYSQLSTDAKLKLMESRYLTNTQFENNWKKNQDRYNKTQQNIDNNWLSALTRTTVHAGGGINAKAWNTGKDVYDEASKKMMQSQNQKIIDNIFNDDVDAQAGQYSDQVTKAYYELYGMSDNTIKKKFLQEITPNSYKNKNGMPNLGIGTYAAYYGNGKNVQSEMSGFSIDDMRQVLAKKKVYEANMSPDMARTALENDAKRYIAGKQSSLTKFGLFMKDVAISSMSYTADKVNGVGELGRMAKDGLANMGVIDKPVVWMDDRGTVVDINKVKPFKGAKGVTYYEAEDGKLHALHKEQMNYTTLQQLGKNTDGSDIKGALGTDFLTLNPQYWSRAEQFGTLDEGEQKQYEKLGASPYKVAYNPNEDGDLWYEAFKMMSFGIADQTLTLMPFGVGAVGRGLQSLAKASKAVQGLSKVLNTTGKVLDVTGKALSASKPAQVINASLGAGGIAYAYGRGAFQETLAQNLANAEEAMTDKVKSNIYDRYQNDKEYKAAIDAMINVKAAKMKQEYIASIRKDGGNQIFDMKAVDKMIRAKAQDAVLGEEIERGISDAKDSQEYADLQQKAIDGAGDAAFNSFWPEAIKYGLVNNLGHRKFLYQNPSGVTRRVSSSLKGIKEITTKDGLKRLATDPSKFKTFGQKVKEFGKTVGSQAWGGAWTNGSDDMMVDAAERINEDSYNRYLDAYKNGEALASTYNFIDGLYSYMKGLQNSMGQETTWNSAKVGALGSIINFAPNFTNIASLATKQGRQSYRDTFRRELLRDENGMPLKNEDGSLKYKENGRFSNLGGKFNFFVQNGILNSYYGKKMAEKDVQSHADYVNKILDDHNDFQDIEGMMAANMATENYANPGDAKTMQFLNALYAMKVLRNVGENADDPMALSSTVQKAKELIDKASKLHEEGAASMSEDEIKTLLSNYYAHNKNVAQSEESANEALYNIYQNAKKLQEADEALDVAENNIKRAEKNLEEPIDPIVKTRLLMNAALTGHWEDRVKSMKNELGDTSSGIEDISPAVVIATVGGRANAKALQTVYTKQEKELSEQLEKDKAEADKLHTEYQKAAKDVDSKEKGTRERTDAESKVKEAKAKYESAKQEVRFKEHLITKTQEKNNRLTVNLEQSEDLGINEEGVREQLQIEKDLIVAKDTKSKWEEDIKNGTPRHIEKINQEIAALEKALAEKKVEVSKGKDKILTADEIFSLDPVTRARMMNKENRSFYNKQQQAEIEKLEQQLVLKDADALQKVQDIGLLTQRIDSNKDAYFRMIENPEAAAFALESERTTAGETAYRLINQTSAETISEYLNQWDSAMKQHQDVTDDMKNTFVYKTLRQVRPDVLEIMETDGLLSQYQKQIADAKEWSNTVGDIDAIISNSDRDEAGKKNLRDNVANVVENANSREELLASLEKVIDDVDNPNAAEDFDFILKGMEKLGYQRDATTLENRKQRKEREAAAKKKREAAKKKVDDAVKAAAEKKAIEESQRKAAEAKKGADSKAAEEAYKQQEAEAAKPSTNVPANGDGMVSVNQDEIVDQNGAEADQKNVSEGMWAADILMEDEMGDTSISLGEAWTTGETPRKGTLSVEKKGNTISMNIDGNTTSLTLDNSQYEITPETMKPEDADNFVVTSLEKKGEDWYFNGNFIGSKEKTQVKVKKDFSLDEAIEKESREREAAAMAKGIDTGNKNLIVEEDSVLGKSETLEEQLEDVNVSAEEDVHISTENIDTTTENTLGERSIENNVTTLSGNSMASYEQQSLKEDGVLKRKTGSKENDSRNQFNSWMDAAGIKLQNIIDQELGLIVARNPHAKVKFMAIRPEHNTTNDIAMQSHLMLVMDYDNNINKGITNIHNDDNGGVIESSGKKYLIIGTVGYGNRNASKLAYYDILWSNSPKSPRGYGIMRTERKKFFDTHPQERFYVNESISTEIVPKSIIPGYIVRQTESDSHTEYRSVREILTDKARNPMGRSFDNLAWGIQERSKFLIIGTSLDKVMVPRNAEGNLGSAFVLMPASNGKMVPSYLKVLKYNEIQEGSLKNKVEQLLEDVTSPDYNNRLQGIIGLSQIFHFSKEGDNLLSRKNRAEISIVHDGEVRRTFTLNSSFDRAAFLQAFSDMNPRVNITAKVLRNKDLLKEYDEAGALQTDAALFGTAGSAYSIYAIDGDGKMVIPQEPTNTASRISNNSDFRNGDRKQIIYRGNYYTEDKGTYYLNGIPVTNERVLRDLQYNKRIIENQLDIVTKDGVWNYFILSSGEHPEVVKVNNNTKEVIVASEDQAKALIEKVTKEEVEKARDAASKELMEKAIKEGTAKLEDVEINNSLKIDPTTGEIIEAPIEETSSTQETTSTKEVEGETNVSLQADITHTSTSDLAGGNQKSTQKFSNLIKNKTYKMRLLKLIKGKWKDAPTNMSKLEDYLRKKDVEVDNIGTSEKDIEAWIHTLENCR